MCDESELCRLRVRLSGDEDMLGRFLRENPPGCERAEPDPRERGRWSIEADVEVARIPMLVTQGFTVEVLYDIAQRRRDLRSLVAKGNRFAEVKSVQGLGAQRRRGG